MTMLASAATARVSTRPAMPGSVSVIGISLTSANRRPRRSAAPPWPPGRARGRRRAGRGSSAPGRRAPASRPWSSACWPSVAETWVSEISLRSIGRAPMRRLSARSLASWKSPTFSICAPVAPVDALRVLDEVDRGQRDDLVVERDREALEGLLLVAARAAASRRRSRARRSAWSRARTPRGPCR